MHSGSTDYAATHATNRYTAITGNLAESNLTHDADGNMTRDGTWYYRYDAENRVYEMEKVNGTQTLQFVYDYLGRRVRKTVRSGGPGASVSSSTKFVWRGWELIAELNAGTGQTGYALLTTYLWGPDFAGHFGSSGGPAGLLAVRQNSNTYFPVYDAMGNVVSYLNSSGTDTARYEYLATGFITGQNGSYGDFDFGFSTQYTDRESGLVYYGKRFYNPKHGRFVNRDPLEEEGGVNLYAHTGNNPANAWDYLGMQRTIWDGPGEGGETPSWPSAGAMAGINPLLFSNYTSPQWPDPIYLDGGPNKPFYDAVNRDQSWQLQSRAAGIGAAPGFADNLRLDQAELRHIGGRIRWHNRKPKEVLAENMYDGAATSPGIEARAIVVKDENGVFRVIGADLFFDLLIRYSDAVSGEFEVFSRARKYEFQHVKDFRDWAAAVGGPIAERLVGELSRRRFRSRTEAQDALTAALDELELSLGAVERETYGRYDETGFHKYDDPERRWEFEKHGEFLPTIDFGHPKFRNP